MEVKDEVPSDGGEQERNLATIAADFYSEFAFERHRGVDAYDRHLIVFGNDSYSTDERAKEEVRLFREQVAKLGLTELDFGLDSDTGCTWAMAIHNNRDREIPARLDQTVWAAWERACGVDTV